MTQMYEYIFILCVRERKREINGKAIFSYALFTDYRQSLYFNYIVIMCISQEFYFIALFVDWTTIVSRPNETILFTYRLLLWITVRFKSNRREDWDGFHLRGSHCCYCEAIGRFKNDCAILCPASCQINFVHFNPMDWLRLSCVLRPFVSTI